MTTAVTDQVQEKATNALMKMLDITIQTMSDVVDFGKQQIPDVIHQLLMWNMAKAGVWLFIGVLVIVLGFIAVRKVAIAAEDDCDGAGIVVWIFGSIFTLLFGLGFVVTNTLDILQIWIAPKVYLIEYAADMIKSAS